MTTTCYEVRDARGKNIGDCFDGDPVQAIDRARDTARAIGGLGKLSVVRVTQRTVIETLDEQELAVVEADGAKLEVRNGALRAHELSAFRRSNQLAA